VGQSYSIRRSGRSLDRITVKAPCANCTPTTLAMESLLRFARRVYGYALDGLLSSIRGLSLRLRKRRIMATKSLGPLPSECKAQMLSERWADLCKAVDDDVLDYDTALEMYELLRDTPMMFDRKE
jgi:hypothetical protein